MIWLLACAGSPEVSKAQLAPEPIGLAECDVCGMIVQEQLAPRGQYVARDGHRAMVCSLEELRAAVQAPSSHGQAVQVWVETLPGGPLVDTTAQQTWVAADDAWFVFGAERPLVMGTPVLAYADAPTAQQVASTLQSVPVRWDTLVTTPFDRVPSGALTVESP